MRVLVLGAGGFIGVNLVERLVSEGRHDVVAVDIDSDKIRDVFPELKDLNFRHLDIRRDEAIVDRLVSEANLVVDLVAVANPSLYVKQPLAVYDLNFIQNLKVVEQCIRHGKHLVQFSTSEVYGLTATRASGGHSDGHEDPFVEDESPLIMGPVRNHRWIYACAKQLLERVLHAHGLEGNLDYTIIRPFNFIGPRIDYLPSEAGGGSPRVFSHFMDALLYGGKMQLVDGGRSYRAYTYIDDAVEAISMILDHAPGPMRNQIVNIGSPANETTIAELATRMQRIFDAEFRIPEDPKVNVFPVTGEEFYGAGYEDCDRRIPSIDKIQRTLGWAPKHDLDSTLKKTMAYFVNRHRSKSA